MRKITRTAKTIEYDRYLVTGKMMTQGEEFGCVTLQEHDAVALLIFSRPPDNYFDADMLGDIATALETVDSRSHLRASVLASEGKIFCAGALLNADDPDPSSIYAAIYRQALRIYGIRKPLVAAVQGAAVGGGLGLALACDFRVASPEARFSANFVRIGTHPGFGLTCILPRLVGAQTSSLIFLAGRRIKADEAVEMGLADVLSPSGEARTHALALAAELAEAAPLALEATRATLRAGLVEEITRQLEVELSHQRRLAATNDFREGVSAVRERRSGNWTRT